MAAKVPCGRNMGHGAWCVENHMCENCEELRHLQKLVAQLRDTLRATSQLLDDALTRMRGG